VLLKNVIVAEEGLFIVVDADKPSGTHQAPIYKIESIR
jgi:hypothetical protein